MNSCRDYLSSLLQYLKDFHQRTQPLGNLKRVEEKVAADFEGRFESGSIPGWEDRGEGSLATQAAQQLDIDAFDSTEELLALGIPQPYATDSSLQLDKRLLNVAVKHADPCPAFSKFEVALKTLEIIFSEGHVC